MNQIKKIDKKIFYQLENYLIKTKNNSDNSSFKEIKDKLNNQPILNSDDFAKEIIYGIMVSGFKQTTAKRFYLKIINCLENNNNVNYDNLINIFKNKKKINSICEIWNNRIGIQKKFYELKNDNEKIVFLSKLPYIGSISKYHIARNFGINCYKPDRWIVRIYSALSKDLRKSDEIYNIFLKKNNDKIYNECLNFFKKEFKELLKFEKIGYIDVILFKSCQQKLLTFNKEYTKLFLNIK